MYPILFSVGSFHVYSLSLSLVVSWVIFSFIFWKLLREQAVAEERIFDLTFYATIAAFLGARTTYILLNPAVFAGNPLKMAALWLFPGLSFWGGLVGGMLILIFLSRRSGVRLGYVLDALAFALPAAFLIGAIGAMLDGAEVGLPTGLPWAVHYAGLAGLRHPLGLYEVILFSFMLIFLKLQSRRAKERGWPYGLLGIWFYLILTVSLFGLEFLKVSRVYWGILSANQWIMVAIFAETVGAFYVRGGGRQALRPAVRQVLSILVQKGTRVYERFFKRAT